MVVALMVISLLKLILSLSRLIILKKTDNFDSTALSCCAILSCLTFFSTLGVMVFIL